ncbi:MocR-like ectoine utilization transcription factor EhuR [Oceanibium sediminis]|uniref:MocR-like ectoine utilization transcription factor EhuR n=1 Tax=Oceanibium sediminis TaxID=2026339 RepID=UPI0018E5A5A7|nr:PLP-dependent aminotransferase family protein [Oceanibium sediminis]
MTIWPPKRENLSRPVYHSLAQALVRAIDEGEVLPGMQLPTHRALAFDLGVSVQTVSRAYEELARLGVISGHVGRGSFVLPKPTDARVPWQRTNGDEKLIDCSMLVPVIGQIHADRMAQVLRDMGEDLPHAALFSFRPRQTLRDHSARALDWLCGCGIRLDSADRLLPTNGSTAALTCALMTAAMPGDLVLAEEMGHHTLASLTATLGLKLSGLAMDEQGVLPEAFERACQNGPVKALCVMPAGIGPTATLMGTERRKAIADVARRHSVWIIENDAWGPLEPDRAPPIAAIAPERTFYFTGLSKCLLPGLRLAWLVVPEAKVHAARTRHLVTNWMATPLIAEIASRWIKDGTAGELLAWQRRELGRRNRIAARILQDIPHNAAPYGMHIWLPLPPSWQEDAFVSLARHDGVAVAAGANFAIEGGSVQRGVRVCLGAGTESELEAGLKALSRLVRTAPVPALLAL